MEKQKATPGGAPASSEEQKTGDGRKIKTVLVVDDEELVRILTENFLEQLGYKVMLAESGEEAVEIFKLNSERIQLILSDITMSGIDGIETVRRIRKISPQIKAIISSGYSSERIDSIPRDSVFLAKPYSITELQSAIRKISESTI